MQCKFDSLTLRLQHLEFLKMSDSWLLLCLSSQDRSRWQELLRGVGKLTGLTTPSPTHPLWPSHVHIRSHFYGNALLT